MFIQNQIERNSLVSCIIDIPVILSVNIINVFFYLRKESDCFVPCQDNLLVLVWQASWVAFHNRLLTTGIRLSKNYGDFFFNVHHKINSNLILTDCTTLLLAICLRTISSISKSIFMHSMQEFHRKMMHQNIAFF